jgi:mRNA interferase MazF
MPITFTPEPGMILMCDFRSGSVPPEMNKIRHVVVVSPRRRRRSGSCLVVPMSTVAPNPVEPYHHRIPADRYSFFKPRTDVWAKCDLVTHVSFVRLDRVFDAGRYASPSLSPEDFSAIRRGVWEALGRPGIQGNRMKGMYQESDGGSWAVIPLGWPFLLRWRNGDPGAWRSVASG